MKKKNLPGILVLLVSFNMIFAILVNETVLLDISSVSRTIFLIFSSILYLAGIIGYIVYRFYRDNRLAKYLKRKLDIQKKRNIIYFNQCVDHILKNEDALFEFKYNLIKNENQKMNLFYLKIGKLLNTTKKVEQAKLLKQIKL